MRKQKKVNCCNCGIEFKKDLSEFKRNEKIGRKNYCSIKCSAAINGKINCAIASKVRIERGIIGGGRKKDEFSIFREYVRRAKRRHNSVNITVQEVKKQWDKQKGICPYTGIELELFSKDNLKKASLDRIDSKLGYIIGNIEFVLTSINFMKNDMGVDETIELCKIISNKWK